MDTYYSFNEKFDCNGITIRAEPISCIVMRNSDGIIVEVQSVRGDVVHSDRIIERMLSYNHNNYLFYRQVGNIHRYFSW